MHGGFTKLSARAWRWCSSADTPWLQISPATVTYLAPIPARYPQFSCLFNLFSHLFSAISCEQGDSPQAVEVGVVDCLSNVRFSIDVIT